MKVLLPQMGRSGWRSSAHLISADSCPPVTHPNTFLTCLWQQLHPYSLEFWEDQWFPQGPTANESPHGGLSPHSDIESRAYATEPKRQVEGVIATVFLNCPPGQESCLRHGMVSECVHFQNIFKCSWPNPSPSGSECIPHFSARWALGVARKCGADLGGSGSSTFWENHQSEIETGICLSITGIFHCAIDWLFKVKTWRQHLFLNTRSSLDPSPGASYYW